jgi:hypothetical protein
MNEGIKSSRSLSGLTTQVVGDPFFNSSSCILHPFRSPFDGPNAAPSFILTVSGVDRNFSHQSPGCQCSMSRLHRASRLLSSLSDPPILRVNERSSTTRGMAPSRPNHGPPMRVKGANRSESRVPAKAQRQQRHRSANCVTYLKQIPTENRSHACVEN